MDEKDYKNDKRETLRWEGKGGDIIKMETREQLDEKRETLK